MTEEQVRHFIISVHVQLSQFIPQDFHKTICKTDKYRWAIENIVRNACFYLIGNKYDYKDLIKSELERLIN